VNLGQMQKYASKLKSFTLESLNMSFEILTYPARYISVSKTIYH